MTRFQFFKIQFVAYFHSLLNIDQQKFLRDCRFMFSSVIYAIMPRIATKISHEVTTARVQLKNYLDQEEHSQTELSRLSDVPQYTISKFLSGRIKTITPEVSRFLSYANIGINCDIERLLKEPLIQNALGNAWDGTEDGIRMLATTINALAPIIRSASTK